MKGKSESLTVADFFEKLQHDQLDKTVPFSIMGMVKKSEGKEKTIEFAPGGNCSNWVSIPLEFIEDVDMMQIISCKDHTHPLVKLNMKTPKTPESKIFFALLEGMKQGFEHKQHNHELPQTGYPSYDMEPTPTSLQSRIGGGGFGGGFGGGLGNNGTCWSKTLVCDCIRWEHNYFGVWTCVEKGNCRWVCTVYN